jgi:hypothetical protein
MMGFSPIDKLVAELTHTSSIADAAGARDRDCELWLPDVVTPKAAVMAHAATALALRCCTGSIVVHAAACAHAGLPWLPGSLIDQVEAAAALYGRDVRVTTSGAARSGALRLALACDAPGAVVADATEWEAGIDRLFPRTSYAVAAASTFAVSVSFARAFSQCCLGAAADDRALRFPLNGRTSGDGGEPPKTSAGDIVLFGAAEVASAFLYVLSLSDCTARVDIVGDGRFAPPDEEQTFLVGASDVNGRSKRALTLAARLKRDGIDARPLAIGDPSGPPSLAPRYDALVCTSFDPAFAALAAQTQAPIVVSASVGDRGNEAGTIHWRRVPSPKDLAWRQPATRTDVVLRQVQAVTAVSTMPAVAELVDQCSRIAYFQTAVIAPFVSLAAGSLAAAACLRGRDHAQEERLQLDLLRPTLMSDR